MTPKKKRIPTKAELLQLQKLYKTDEKIGERLGGIPPYLIAYWRRKKNIPKHSQPKFSEKEIITLWERFGDDDKCGLELGISKAAFYNWRRRYGIKQKPAFLKLEQLELNFPGLKINSTSTSLYGKQTIIQKVVAGILDLTKVDVGEKIEIEPDLVISHLNAYDIIDNFKQLNTDLVWNPSKIFISLANSSNQFYDSPASKYKKIREFVKRQGIKNFYEVSEGICYQVAIEKGHVLPGLMIAGSDKYMNSVGALAASPVNLRTDQLAKIWSGAKAEWKIPPTIQINISGRRSRGVYSKDIALSVIKQLAPVNINGKAIEFYGNTVNQMSISERITLCNHVADIGAVTASCHFDSVTRRYLTGRTMASYNPVIADKNAEYQEIYQINIDHLTAQLSKPNESGSIKPVVASEGLPVNIIIIGSVVNGRFDDLRVAAEILKNKQVNSECRLFIYPGSRSVYIEALKKGLIRVLAESGAVIIYPGYPEHTGITGSLLDDGDRVLATCNNNLIPSIRHERAEIYLCSPATAAASALNGSITEPRRFVK